MVNEPFFKIFGKGNAEEVSIAGRGEYLTVCFGNSTQTWSTNLLYDSPFDVRLIDNTVVLEDDDPYINRCDFVDNIYNINGSNYSFSNGVINVTGFSSLGMGINTYIDQLGSVESHPYLNVKIYGILSNGSTVTLKNQEVYMPLDTRISQKELFTVDLTQYDFEYIVYDINNKDVTLPSAWSLDNKNTTKLAFYAHV